MAGRVQIEALGQLSNFLTADPSFSFFTKRFSKYANYASENCKISFPKGVYTDDFLDVTIPQNCGDILQEITLSFTVDPTNITRLGSNISPIDVFGISAIDYVELRVGDELIDTITSDDIFIDRELNIPESYRSSLDVLHGKHFQGSSDREFLQEFYDGQFSTQGIDPFSSNEYRIQIPFYFHRRPGHGFPLCAAYKQELSLRIKIRPTNDLLFVSQEKFSQNIWNPRVNNQVTEPFELSNFQVNLSVVHLDTIERCMIRSRTMDIMFEQHQRNTFMIDKQSKVGNFRLDFKNCVKELFFIAKKTGKWSDEYVSILDQLHQLDNYTASQQTTLFILKLIPIWSGAIGNVLDTLVGETDTTTRTSLIDAVLNLFYWGTDDTYTSILEDLKTQSVNDQTNVTTIKTYLNSIPGTILGIQLDATTKLNSLIGEMNPVTRSITIDALLAYDNVWGPEQIGLLNVLRYPGIPTEDLIIFGLRVYVTTISYYLTGLSQLKPGTVEQIATINKITEIFDNTKAEYDIIKFGLKGVLDNIPGKTAYIRSRIVYAVVKIGTFTLGQNRAIWSQTQLDQLNSLIVDPGSNTTLIAVQRATIDSLIGFLDSLDDIKGYISAQLSQLDGELNYDTREDIANNLLNLVNFNTGVSILDLINPADFWGQDEKDIINVLSFDQNTPQGTRDVVVSNVLSIGGISWSPTDVTNLNALKDSGTPLAGTGTEDTAIGYLNTYANGETVSDSLYAKNTIDYLLDTIIVFELDQATRQSLVQGLLSFDVEGRPYWDDAMRYLINELADATLPVNYQNTHILPIRIYMNAVVYGLRLIIEGLVGTTGIEYTIDRLLTALDGELVQGTREDLVDGLLAIPSVWRQTEVNLLNALKDSGTPLGGTATEDTYILALRIQSNTNSSNFTAGIIPGGFPGRTLAERIANVTVLRLLPVWEDTIIKLVNGYYYGDPNTPTLISYLQGKLGTIPILKFRLNVLKSGISGILDTLPATAEERDPIIVGITTLHAWTETEFFYLNALRTPSVITDPIYINLLKTSPTAPAIMTGYTQFDQNNVIDGIITETIWGSYYFNLNDLRQIEPGSLGQSTVISQLGAYIGALPSYLGYIIDGVDTTLDTLPGTSELRTPIIESLLSLQNIWQQSQIDTLNALKIPSGSDAIYIAQIKGYINGVVSVYDNAVTLLSYTNKILASEVDTLKTYVYWGADQLSVLTQLEFLVDVRGPSGEVTDAEVYFKNILDLYTKGIRFYWNLAKEGIDATASSIATVSNSVERGILIGLLLNFPIWGTDQLTLLNELRTVDSKNHIDAIDAITSYLDMVYLTIYNPSVPSGLLIDIQNPTTTSTDLQDTDLKKAVWGGYFYYLLEALQNPAITTGTEGGIIAKLSTHVNISSSSESRTNNLNFLIRQLLVTYPEIIFNKWVRAKKNVPLMYSKQKYVTLKCDGIKILDEKTGSNTFLSASLPNLYHKRSPNFRNINMYSFALHPQDLLPSGHLNFSTVKNADVYMELEYDGVHGTFDFDDNYISLFGINPIYFPKQVIIIAKSYNTMIIRNGEVRIIF